MAEKEATKNGNTRGSPGTKKGVWDSSIRSVDSDSAIIIRMTEGKGISRKQHLEDNINRYLVIARLAQPDGSAYRMESRGP